nr:hypothetical protein [Tanacetum cinerariifolium]
VLPRSTIIKYLHATKPNNKYNPQPSFNQNYMQQPMPNPEDITDLTTTINMALVLMAKRRCHSCKGLGHLARNYTVRSRRMDADYLQTQLLIAQKEDAGNQLQAKEFDLMAAIADLDEIKEVNAHCILMANLQQASTSVTQTDKSLIYDSNGS